MLTRHGEEGQALFIVVGAMTVIFVIGAITVDVGLWLSERRSAQTVADVAALAASQELPNDSSAAIANAYAYADENGYTAGADGVQIDIALLCTNRLADPPAGLCANGSAPAPSACASGAGCDAVRVTIRRPAGNVFTSLLGLGGIEVSADASAVAGISAVPQSTLLLFDSSGDMVMGACGGVRDANGCFEQAKAGARELVDVLTSSGESLVGFIPYNYCYNFSSPSPSQCVREELVIPPTTDPSPLLGAIGSELLGPFGYVNACVPLGRAAGLLDAGPAPRAIVLVSRGDNVGFHNTSWPGVPASCRPASNQNVNLQVGCRQSAAYQEREVDLMAWQTAEQLKQRGAEIYVVGLLVCGRNDGRSQDDLGYCAGIGDTAHDNIADQRLLKCIASSPEHYHPVSDPRRLPETLTDIALTIAKRGLLE